MDLTYDNIAIVVLIAGNVAQWRLSQRRHKEFWDSQGSMLDRLIERERAYMARMEEQAQYMGAVQQGQRAARQAQTRLSDTVNVGFSHLAKGLAVVQRSIADLKGQGGVG